MAVFGRRTRKIPVRIRGAPKKTRRSRLLKAAAVVAAGALGFGSAQALLGFKPNQQAFFQTSLKRTVVTPPVVSHPTVQQPEQKALLVVAEKKTSSKSVSKPVPKPIVGPLDFRIQGKPSLSEKTIERIVGKTPLAGKSAFILQLCRQYNIDPAVALAQFQIESGFGKEGAGAKKKNPGNIRGKTVVKKIKGRMVKRQTFRNFGSWEDGLRTYFWQIAKGSHAFQVGRFHAESIIPAYAPEKDGNDPKTYIRQMRELVAEFR